MTTPNSDKKPSTPPPAPPAKGPPPGVPTPTADTRATNAAIAATNGTMTADQQTGGNGDAAADKAANRSKVFIVIGEVHEFPTAAAAEKFLNQPNGPTKFSVLKGHKVESKQRVSLRG